MSEEININLVGNVENEEELREAANAAVLEHFRITPGIMPHSLSLQVLKDITEPHFKETVCAMTYYLRDDDAYLHVLVMASPLATIDIDNDVDLNEAISEGKIKKNEDGGLAFTLEMELRLYNPDRPISFFELCSWAAIQDAEESGNHEKAERLFNALYTEVPGAAGNADTAPALTLATYKSDGIVTFHTLAMKAIEGLAAIAYGEKSYEIAPAGGRSRERYVITASEDACADYFAKQGGNAEFLKRLAEVTYTLATDQQAALFEHEGRVWFTVSAIAEQASRTAGGMISGRKSTVTVAMVDAGLRALSGAQIVGTDPSGKPTNVMYLVNAERRENVTYKGQVFNEVWGFTPKGSVGSYSKSLGRNYRYPLLESEEALTMDEAGCERFLSELLHEARGELYTTDRDGNPKPTRKASVTIKRSYETLRSDRPGVFQRFYPIKPPDGRQKNKLVKTLEKVLTDMAAMEVHGSRHEGMPMSLEAYSERDPSRGRGAGLWVSLVITARRNTKVPKIDLMSGKKPTNSSK